MSGRVLVEWAGEDRFVYRRRDNPLTFRTSDGFVIQPGDMYTDGGSIPQVFRGIPGLSPWGLGPAYIIHDWLFYRHRCGTEEERAEVDFRQSARILKEVAVELRKAKLAPDSVRFIDAIVGAVSGTTARRIWNRPYGTDCDPPPAAVVLQLPRIPGTKSLDTLRAGPRRASPVVDFVIPNY